MLLLLYTVAFECVSPSKIFPTFTFRFDIEKNSTTKKKLNEQRQQSVSEKEAEGSEIWINENFWNFLRHIRKFFYVPACTWFLVIIFRIFINCIYRSCKHKIWSVYTFKNCGIFENIKLSHTHTAQAIKLKATLKILFIILFMYVKHFTWFAVVVCRWGYKYRCEEKN